MRALILKALRDYVAEGGLNQDDEEIIDFATEVEALSDEDLLALYTWSVSFQG